MPPGLAGPGCAGSYAIFRPGHGAGGTARVLLNIKSVMKFEFECPDCNRKICGMPDEQYGLCPKCLAKLEKALREEQIDEVIDALDGKRRWPQTLILPGLPLALGLGGFAQESRDTYV
jgi:hypothetical protein